MKLLLLGATGFVGKTLLKTLLTKPEYVIHAVVREVSKDALSISDPRVVVHTIESITSDIDWTHLLIDCDCVIYAAGYAHVMGKPDEKTLSLYSAVNMTGALNLARQAAKVGVKRFVFISSIKVNGEYTLPNAPLQADSPANPLDAYARSKYEAEEALFKLAHQTALEVVVIRPPLIYGPGVKGNLNVMIKWLKRGMVLPLGSVHNQRSLVSVYNLSSLIAVCVHHQAARNQVFLVSDGADVSTTTLLKKMGRALSVPTRLLSVPTGIIRLGFRLIGKRGLAERLLGSLALDITKTKDLLGWVPDNHMDTVLEETARFFERRCIEENAL
ncbi:MAG: NAD-dependent epimerase/dehydratase family protein [Legionellaceae bacterium]|nr:NAD-dependent epimerase/dehydratase family protein [Legionellaceae bacterium]